MHLIRVLQNQLVRGLQPTAVGITNSGPVNKVMEEWGGGGGVGGGTLEVQYHGLDRAQGVDIRL